jgi:hypothetical protein
MQAALAKRFGLAAALLLCCGLLVALIRLGSREPEDFWSSRRGLCESEKAYFMDRADRLLERWRYTRSELYARPGESPPPYGVFLVVDLSEPAMWIERAGKVWEGWRVDLPSKLAWSIQRQFVGGVQPLPARSVFKIRGWKTSLELPENVYVVGSTPDRGHIAFKVNPGGGGQDLGSGDFQLHPMPPPERTHHPEEESYPSIVVGEEEYEASLRAAEGTRGKMAEKPWLAEHRADWTRIEAKLYREIERQVEGKGLHLDRLTVHPGPDFHAGHAEFRATRRGMLAGLLPRPTSSTPELNFDFLGDGVWYARSVNARPRPRNSGVGFEFLVSEHELASGSESDSLAKGRERAAPVAIPPSRWSIMLPGGTQIEFVGVCRAPSLGEQWWGPDGSRLPTGPYMSTRTSPFDRQRSKFEIAWRTVRRISLAPSHMTYSALGSRGSGFYASEDRYGRRLTGLHYEQYSFDEGTNMTTLRIGVGPDESQLEWAEFRNVSLVPGQDFGFEMVGGQALQ